MDVIGLIFDAFLISIVKLNGSGLSDLLKFENDANGNFPAIMPLWDYFILVGICLTIVYFIVEVNKKWAFEGQSMTLKTMMIPFIKLAIAIIVMANAANIFSAIVTFSNTFVTWVDTEFGTIDLSGGSFSSSQIMDNLGFWAKIFLLLPLTLGILVSIVCNIVWAYKALLYKLELSLRVGFAPIALADVYSGQNGTAVKYIKGTIALVLYGGSLIILPRLCSMLTLEQLNALAGNLAAASGAMDTAQGWLNLLLTIFELIIAPIAAIGLTGTAKQITKEAVG